jgi:hypothetical protein
VASVAFVLYLVMSLAISAISANPSPLVGSPWIFVTSIGASIVQAVLLAPLAMPRGQLHLTKNPRSPFTPLIVWRGMASPLRLAATGRATIRSMSRSRWRRC